MTFRALLIDWAGTITVSLRDVVLQAAASLELSPEQMGQALGGLSAYMGTDDSLFHQAERGEIHDDELRAWLDSLAPGAGRLVHPDHPGILQAPDRPEVLALMDEARHAGIVVVVATNNFASARPMLKSRYLDTGRADAIVNSADIGVRKPSTEFYQRCMEVANTDVSHTLFCDDMAPNIIAAEAFGLRSVSFGDSIDQALEQTRTLLGLA
ncbi:MAG: HAD-IA family hydrolase [Acidimicrobiales bacterium]